MSGANILLVPVIRAMQSTAQRIDCTLPGVFAALARDEIECFPVLRAHQVPAWHMFLAQLGAIAMHRARISEPPRDEAEWLRIIRALTSAEFPDDEPWKLAVADETKPAFMQSPVPAGTKFTRDCETPDALDMVITSKNHDLKRAVAIDCKTDDWLFALISLQTCEGYGGAGNNGIARMNGGSSSRVCLGLAPMPEAQSDRLAIRPGVRLRRDLEQLAIRRESWMRLLTELYPLPTGAALLWTLPWPDGASLQIGDLDPLFIEVCRRVRLSDNDGRITARAGTSETTRIAAKELNGVLGDPWAPVNRTQCKALTLGEEGDFDFSMLTKLLSGDWDLPLLATLGPGEVSQVRNWVLIAQAFARGNSKTGGFKERIIPITGKAARAIGPQRAELHKLASIQIEEIKRVTQVLGNAIALASVGGDREDVNKDAYESSQPYRKTLRVEADRLFFPALWRRFEAEELGAEAAIAARTRFLCKLDRAALRLLDDAMADLPCSSLLRPRAEARARALYFGGRKKAFPAIDFSSEPFAKDAAHVSA